MKNIKIILISLFILSCGPEDPVFEPIEVMIVTNLHSPTTSEPGQPPSGKFVKFSFAKQTIVTGDDWDVAFRATTILVNGGFSDGQDEPSRTGLGGGYVTVGNYGSIKSADENLIEQDSETNKAIKLGSGSGWYNYDSQTHLITPIAGRTLVFKTHNGRYAKMQIISYYKDSPETPNAFSSQSQYYTFNYTYQPNEGVTSFD